MAERRRRQRLLRRLCWEALLLLFSYHLVLGCIWGLPTALSAQSVQTKPPPPKTKAARLRRCLPAAACRGSSPDAMPALHRWRGAPVQPRGLAGS